MATITTGYTFVNNETVTPAKLNSLAGGASISGIVNADVSASAAITDTKLATISTAGKVSGNAVTSGTIGGSTAINTSGTITAGTITATQFNGPMTGTITGNASSATVLQTPRAISITGAVTATGVNFNGSAAISLSTAISSLPDSSLATISTAGKVANTATTATSANTVSAIVARDASGNFSAGTITAALTGNATTATTLQTARTIAISGDVTGTATSFNGSGNISIPVTINAGAVTAADIAAAAGIEDSKLATIATALKVSNSATTATSANTASAIVARDASGNFSAGTITATQFNGPMTGTITGNASSASVLQTPRAISLTGAVTATGVNFDGSTAISLSTAISSLPDSSLATISTAGKVANAATTATSANTASAIVARDASGNFSAGTITATAFAGAGASLLVPTGAVMPFAMNSAPTGWLAADGAAVSRTTYSALWTALGTTSSPYGQGDGSTTFNLPDLRASFVRGAGSDGTATAGSFGVKQADAFQGHIHSATGSTGASVQAGASGIGQTTAGNTGAAATDGTNGTPRTASETRPRNIAMLYCIKS